MAKRKAVDLPKDASPPNRRKTRSSGPIVELQPVATPLKKRRGRPPGIPASEAKRSSDGRGSSKENGKGRGSYKACDTSDDELILLGTSPSRRRTDIFTPRPSTPSNPSQRTPSKRGQTMDAVVITTPRFSGLTSRNNGEAAAGSPSPSRPARALARALSRSPSHHETKRRVARRESQPFPAPGLSSSPPASPAHPEAGPSRITKTSSTDALIAHPLPSCLPAHLLPSFQSQKLAVLHALHVPPLWVKTDETIPDSAFIQLTELLDGTTLRNEGNSCLVLGPRGSGKGRLIDRALASSPSNNEVSPVVIRLSAHCQTNDRLAMREIARQIHQQIGSDLAPQLASTKYEEHDDSVEDDEGKADIDLPPPSQLPALISALPSLGRPVIVILDAFDGFAAHARQALLYCLLDTVQSCRGGTNPTRAHHNTTTNPSADGLVSLKGDNNLLVEIDGSSVIAEHDRAATPKTTARGEHGLLVIGVTSRVDCLTLLEKRVKSRFSHRVMRTSMPSTLDDFVNFTRSVLCVDKGGQDDAAEEWKGLWKTSVENFLVDKVTLNVLRETFAFSKDLRSLCRLLTSPVTALTPINPWLMAAQLSASVAVQRCPKHFPFLSELPYPHIALLIAATHSRTAGHDTFNFEILYDKFITQVRTSASAPVQIEGTGIGMVKVRRGVMMGAFEHLVTTRVFHPIAAPTAHITRDFAKYRCVAEWDEIKACVEHNGQTALKKWFSKAQ